MICQEIVDAISWSRKSTPHEPFGVMAYLTRHIGSSTADPTSEFHKDDVIYCSGPVTAAGSVDPHLKGTLQVAFNSEFNGNLVVDSNRTYDVQIFPTGKITYQQQIKGKPVGGLSPTQVQATCLNNALLTATVGAEVITVGVARKPATSLLSVEYRQIANFTEYLLAPDAGDNHAEPNVVYVMYRIKKISNGGPSAKTFVFDVDSIFTVAPDQTSNETVTNANILLPGQNLTTMTVNAGQVVIVDKCFIKGVRTSNPQSLLAAKVPLKYALSITNQSVTLTDVDAQSPVAEVGPALPKTLQSLCMSN